MVGVLGLLNAIEEAAVDDGVPGGSDGGKQERGAGGIAARDRSAPLLHPVLAGGYDGVGGYAAEEGGLVQQGMADPAVAPVEQGERAAVAAEIAGMDIAMDERIEEAAGG